MTEDSEKPFEVKNDSRARAFEARPRGPSEALVLPMDLAVRDMQSLQTEIHDNGEARRMAGSSGDSGDENPMWKHEGYIKSEENRLTSRMDKKYFSHIMATDNLRKWRNRLGVGAALFIVAEYVAAALGIAFATAFAMVTAVALLGAGILFHKKYKNLVRRITEGRSRIISRTLKRIEKDRGLPQISDTMDQPPPNRH